VAAIETRVDLVKTCMGADGRFIDYAVETGRRGIVLEVFGRGNVTLAMTEAVGRAVMWGTHVAVASRSPQGRVAPTYTGGGGGHDLKQVGTYVCRRPQPSESESVPGSASRRWIVPGRGSPTRGIPRTIGWSWVALNGRILLFHSLPTISMRLTERTRTTYEADQLAR